MIILLPTPDLLVFVGFVVFFIILRFYNSLLPA